MPIYAALIVALTIATVNVALSAPDSVRTVSTDSQASDAQRQACTPDVFRLCGHAIPDVTGIVACLKAQRPNLSADCRATFDGRLR